MPLVAQLLEARLHLCSAKGRRSVVAGEFFSGPMTTALAPDSYNFV